MSVSVGLRSIGLTIALLALSSCGSGTGGGGTGGGGTGGGVTNRAPTFSSPSSVTYNENTVGPAYIATASDPDGDPLTFAIAPGGADNARFAMRQDGEFYFTGSAGNLAGNYESAADVGGNNVYELSISVTDGKSAPVIQTVQISVANGPEFEAALVASGLLTTANPPELTAAAATNDGSGRIYTAELGGVVRIFSPGQPGVRPTFMDLRGTSASQITISGLAPAPDFAASGRFFVLLRDNTSVEVRRYDTVAGNRDAIDLATGDVIFRTTASCCEQSGWIGFGPDNLLYINTRSGTDQEEGEAQLLTSLRGKILRIDVGSDAFPGDPLRDYAIPNANPYVAGGGLPEIFVRGFRNPRSGQFDRANGNLYMLDPSAGGSSFNELNIVRPSDGGRDYGFPACQANGSGCSGTEPPVFRCIQAAENCGTLTAGLLYRGPFTELNNVYLFADSYGLYPQRSSLSAIENRLLQVGAPVPRDIRAAFRSLPGFPLELSPAVVSMVQSEANTIYFVTRSGDIYEVRQL